MRTQQIADLLATLESMETLAGDVIDGVALIRAEIEQTYDKIEQPYHKLRGRESA